MRQAAYFFGSLVAFLTAASGVDAQSDAVQESAASPAERRAVDLESWPVLKLRIEAPQAALDSLRKDPRAYVRGILMEGDATYKDVGIRLKGSAGSFQPLEQKPGFTVKMNQFLPQGRFRGLRKFLLNNAAQDPSYLSECVGNALFRAAGIPAPSAGFARVELNGRDLGLYVLIEGVARDFLARHFQDSTGNLYEGPGEVTDDLDTDSRGGAADRSDLQALAAAARIPEPNERWVGLGKLLDMDRFISFVAMEVLTWHWDGYAIGANNYRIYHDPSTGLITFIPHGADQLFQDAGASIHPEMRGLVAKAVMETPEGRRRYRDRLEALLSSVLDLEEIHRRIDALQAKLRPALVEENPAAPKRHAEAVISLLGRIAERMRSVREQLSEKPASPSPLEFDAEGVAHPSGWQPRGDPGDATLAEVPDGGVEGKAVLTVSAGPQGGCVASWRTRVFLPPGRYRFQGQLRLEGFAPFEGELEDSSRPSGACLRISGRQPEKKLRADAGWTRFEFDFNIDPEAREAQLVCELRAARGKAWFDVGSLEVLRLRPGATE